MKKIAALLVFAFLYHTVFSQTWKQVSSTISDGMHRGGAFSIDSTGFIFGGNYNGSGRDMWKYDTATHNWTQVATYPSDSIDGLSACSLNGIGYSGTGAYCCYQFGNAFFKYDPNVGANGTWTRLPNFPGGGRAYTVAFALNGKVYIGGGLWSLYGSSYIRYQDFYAYDPATNKWDTVAPCPAAGVSCDAVAFTIGDTAYVGCGGKISLYGSNPSVPQNDFWKFDPTNGAKGTWTRIADIPGTRAESVAFSTCDKGYVGLGYTDSTRQYDDSDFWEYNPLTGTWKQIENFSGGPRNAAFSFTINKTGYVACGLLNGIVDAHDTWDFTAIVTPAFSADTSICAGGFISFSDTSNYSPTNWLWHFPGGTPDSSNQQSPIIQYDSAGTYDVILSAWNGCDSASKTFTQYVTVSPSVSADIQPQSPTICNGQVIELYVNGGGASFTWSPAIGLSATTGDTVLANPTATITYAVTGKGAGGCSATGIDVVSVVPAPNKPTISISSSGDTLISSATQGNQWYYNDTIINGATNENLVITGNKTGSYTVEVINPANGCSATSDALITSGINQLAIISNQLSIYPNPTTGNIFIIINSSAQSIKDWNMEIDDVLGRILFTRSSLNYSNEIDLSKLSDGVYFITIANKTERAVFAVTKQN